MTKHPITLAIALAFAASATLSGCDRTSNLTEQEHIQRAKDFEDKGQFRGSIVELKNAIQKNPDSPQARLILGQIYLKTGMGAEAEKELSQAEKLGVNRESIKPQLGEALLLMGEYQRVLDEIQPGEQTSKTNLARILQVRADALLKQGKFKEACTLFQQSLDTDTGNPPTYWGLAQCEVAERDMTKAKQWLDAALKINDKQAKTWTYIGDWEQLNKNPPGALAAYSSALKFEPNDLEALQNRATLSMTLGQLEAASQDIEKIGKLAPKSLAINYLQALLNFQQKKYPEARDALQEVFKTRPDHMPSVLLAGTTAYALGSYQQAETHFKRFLARFPGHAYARRMLAVTQIELKQSDKALETLTPLLSSDTKDAQALALAGEMHLMKQESPQAAELLGRAALIDPKNAGILTQLGLSRFATGDSQFAITTLETAASLDPGQYKADTFLVLAHLERKEYEKALAAISNLEKKHPRSPAIHSLRGRVYLAKKDLANARKSFEQALAIEPSFFPAVVNLAQLDMRDNKPEVARRRFESVLSKDKNNIPAMMALAEIAGASKNEKDYVNWLDRAAKADPKAIEPRTKLTYYYLTKKENDKAVSLAKATLNANQENPIAINLLGATYLSTGDKVNALTTYNQLVKKLPDSPLAHYKLALAQIASKQHEQAYTSLKKALQLKPDFIQAQDMQIRLNLTENKIEEALRIARDIQNKQPDSPLGYDREGLIYTANRQFKQAANAYEKAVSAGAGSAGIVKLHQVYTLAGQNKLADQKLADWLKQHPKDTAVFAYGAEYFMNTGRNKESVALHEALVLQVPNNALVLNNLAVLYQHEKDKRALPTAEQAYKLAPENPDIQDTLGWILVGEGQVDRALGLLRKAIDKRPKSATLRYHYAVALAHTNKKAEARRELEQAIASDQKFPELDDAKNMLKSMN